MTNEKTEIYRQFAFQIVRYIFIAVGGWLVKKGVIDDQTAQGITSADVIYSFIGLILVVIPVVWGYFKSRFNIKFAIAAHQADAGTPLSVIKTEVLANESKVSSV